MWKWALKITMFYYNAFWLELNGNLCFCLCLMKNKVNKKRKRRSFISVGGVFLFLLIPTTLYPMLWPKLMTIQITDLTCVWSILQHWFILSYKIKLLNYIVEEKQIDYIIVQSSARRSTDKPTLRIKKKQHSCVFILFCFIFQVWIFWADLLLCLLVVIFKPGTLI